MVHRRDKPRAGRRAGRSGAASGAWSRAPLWAGVHLVHLCVNMARTPPTTIQLGGWKRFCKPAQQAWESRCRCGASSACRVGRSTARVSNMSHVFAHVRLDSPRCWPCRASPLRPVRSGNCSAGPPGAKPSALASSEPAQAHEFAGHVAVHHGVERVLRHQHAREIAKSRLPTPACRREFHHKSTDPMVELIDPIALSDAVLFVRR